MKLPGSPMPVSSRGGIDAEAPDGLGHGLKGHASPAAQRSIVPPWAARCRLGVVGAGAAVALLVLASFSASAGGGRSGGGALPCFSGPPATFLDPNHPKVIGIRIVQQFVTCRYRQG